MIQLYERPGRTAVWIVLVLGVIVLLLFPSIGSHPNAKIAQARVAVLGLTTALRAYYSEYGKWPGSATDASQDVATNLFENPRQILFYEFRPKDIDRGGLFIDPWKHPYRVCFALAPTNQIANPFQGGDPRVIPTGVIVWSRGPDGKSSEPNAGGKPANDADNITSW